MACDAGCHLCGVCTISGWQGGLALLSNLERSPMVRIMLRGLPAQGGFEAAYYGESCRHTHAVVPTLSVCRHLLLVGLWAAHFTQMPQC